MIVTYVDKQLIHKDLTESVDLGETLTHNLLTEITLLAFRYKAGKYSLTDFKDRLHDCLIEVCDPYEERNV